MRILLVSNLLPPDYDGGYEISALKVAEGLRARGHDVEIATSRFRTGFAPVAEAPWVHRIFEFRPSILGSPLEGWAQKTDALRRLVYNEGMVGRNRRALRRLLQANSYDVAYVFGLHHVGLGVTAELTKRSVPILWHFGDHNLADRAGYWDISATYRLAARTLLRASGKGERSLDLRYTAFISDFLLGYYQAKKVPLGKTWVLPRGVEFALGSDVDRPRESPPVILMAGRISITKGYHVAIEALADLRNRRPDLKWTCRIVGGGDEDYLARLKAQSASLGTQIEFTGKLSRERVIELLRTATVFLSASIWEEPFGRTLIEAMGAGTPLIASITGATLEIVEPEVSALIYSKEDSLELSRQLERVLEDADLRTRLAKGGILRVAEAYSQDAIVARTERILSEIVSSSGGS